MIQRFLLGIFWFLAVGTLLTAVGSAESFAGTYNSVTAPTSITQSSSGAGITLSWSAPSSGTPTSYVIERSTTGLSWTSVGTVAGATTSTTIRSGLAANTSYYFRVAAVSGANQGPWGYPWTEIYRTLTPNRNSTTFSLAAITYVSGFSLSAGDAASNYKSSPGTTAFSRIRYRLTSTINSVSRYADVNFEKWTSANRNTATGSNWDPDIDSIRIPSTATGQGYTVHANVTDMTIDTNSPDVRSGYGILGRLEIWPWNYSQGRSGLSPAGDAGTYDYDDTPASGANTEYGSFQVHTLEDNEAVFAWNRHSNGQNAEVGYGNQATGHPDWTFCGASAGVCTPSSFQLSIFVNPPITTSSTLTPINSAAPTISGVTTFNETLTATTGTWSNTPTSYSYQWSRSSSSGGTYASITGATSSSYRLTSSDVGQFLKVTVTATNSAGSDSATSNATTQVSKANRTLTLTSLGTASKAFPFSQSLNIATSVSAGGGTLSYAVSNDSALGCNLSDTTSATTTISATTSGTCFVRATIAADSSYESATSTTATFTFSKASQTISFASLAPKTLGMDSFTVTASASSGLAVSFASSNSGICSVAGSVVTLVSAGTCTITASQAGNTNYDSATAVSQSFTISSALLITTPSGAGLVATYDSAYTLSLISSGGATPRTFALSSGSLPSGLSLETATGVISGTPSAAGSSSLAIRVTDSNTATATTSSFTITVAKAQPLLSSFSIATKTFGNAPFALTSPTVTGSIPGSFTYTSSNLSVATISTNNVTIVGGGSSTITALFTPTDTSNYESATITATLTVNRASQATLTITTLNVAFGDTLTLETSGGSGNGNVTFTKDSGPCTISSSTLTPTAVGSCIVIATKGFDTNYLAESSTATTITIVQGSPSATLTFSSTTLTFGITNTLTITASVAGKVRFSANGRVIKSCKERATALSSPFVATCRYKPATRRPLTITATLTPTDLGFASRTTTSSTFLVQRRTGGRG